VGQKKFWFEPTILGLRVSKRSDGVAVNQPNGVDEDAKKISEAFNPPSEKVGEQTFKSLESATWAMGERELDAWMTPRPEVDPEIRARG